MIDRPHSMNIASDDRYWAVPVMTVSELEALIQGRRAWVRDNATVLNANNDNVPAELSEHFTMVFSSTSNGLGAPLFLIEGIDHTGLIVVRSQPMAAPIFPIHNSNGAPITIDVFYRYDPSRPNGPWLFTSHMEIGTDVAQIARTLVRAKTDPHGFADALNSSAYIKVPHQVDPDGKTLRSAYSVTFVSPSNIEIEVVYSGQQADGASIEDTVPIACNPLFGSATLTVSGELVLSLETSIVKAYLP